MLVRCPRCQAPLIHQGKLFRCEQGHSYDQAKEGYVNLLLPDARHSRQPGDTPEAVRSRRAFLEKGYYQPLAETLARLVFDVVPAGALLDAGCGTGYYLDFLAGGDAYQILAVDLSKTAVAMCAKHHPGVFCFVGSLFHLPLAPGCLDGIISVFSPYSAEEFARVLKPDGAVFAVTPGREHLYELKQVVYPHPYYNDEAGYNMPGFVHASRTRVRYEMALADPRDIAALWKMTPYYHTSALQDSAKLLALPRISATADFLIDVYRREAGHA
jgi:23S rRNA (guanine745-N1)-methyltransferase